MSRNERHFPILLSKSERDAFSWAPKSVPWSVVAPHEEQSIRNHGQSLSQLASRGGLRPIELRAVMSNLSPVIPEDPADFMFATWDALLWLEARSRR